MPPLLITLGESPEGRSTYNLNTDSREIRNKFANATNEHNQCKIQTSRATCDSEAAV